MEYGSVLTCLERFRTQLTLIDQLEMYNTQAHTRTHIHNTQHTLHKKTHNTYKTNTNKFTHTNSLNY